MVGYLGAFGLCEVETVEKVIAVSAAGRALGEDAPRARWSERDVERVRALCAAGATIAEAARAVGMPYDTARDIVRGRRRGVLPAAWVSVRGRRRVVGR